MTLLPALPQHLKIGGHFFDVCVGEVGGDCWAEVDRGTNTITISSELSASQQWSSLVHEIIHVQNTQLENTEVSHLLLDSLAEQFFQVLADNDMLK